MFWGASVYGDAVSNNGHGVVDSSGGVLTLRRLSEDFFWLLSREKAMEKPALEPDAVDRLFLFLRIVRG